MLSANSHLAKLLVERSFLRGRFVLASGRTSDFYFDCKRTTHLAEAKPLIGRAFAEELRQLSVHPKAVGGLTSGADPIANALAYYSVEADGSPINSFVVRKDRKSHGTQHWIDGCVAPGDSVAIVDDVVTSGGSVIQAIERCKEEDLRIVYVGFLVDREEGGLERIREAAGDVPVTAIFKKSQLDALVAQNNGGD